MNVDDTPNYKKTLNLPRTAFPMKADLVHREVEVLKRWEAIGLYDSLRQQAKAQNRPRFVLHDGPPYANGRPHLGTALNKILKDVIVKSKTLAGYDAPFVPGWDCHGLPIELNVEKKHGKPSQALSVQAFRKACREYATEQCHLQLADFQRLGVIADWVHPYLTMDFKYEADVVRALACIIENGHLQRGYKPVHWCTDCGSALAETEVEYRDKTSSSVYVRFDAVDAVGLLSKYGVVGARVDAVVTVPIWTTTPWTLPANQAVCVHPRLRYALLQSRDGLYYVLAEALIAEFTQQCGILNYQLCGTVAGQVLEHSVLQHPFLERKVSIILGEHVTADAGTGNVHTAPAHGQEDYRVGKQYDLPLESPVNAAGCFVESTPKVAGLYALKSNECIITWLAERGRLLHQASFQHSYPHCWRHKIPLIFRATPQWFLSMDAQHLRAAALAEIKKTNWLPAWGAARISSMVEARPDWCISRQRFWGIPLALFVHKKTGILHPNTLELMETVACLIEKNGVDAWYDCEASHLIGADDAAIYDKVIDTLDVWFDSGVSHYAVLAQRSELQVPADLYFEGSDQHRGWFNSALVTAVAMHGHAPFKAVLTHGYVVDGKGFKMSKSLGNVVAPSEVVQEFGADILRLWAASVDHAGDVNFSREILQRTVDAYRRIRNTARFFLSNLEDFNPLTDIIPVDQMVELDRWAVSIASALQEKVMTAYADYNFQEIYQLLHNFCSVEMGSFYLDIIKDRQYTAKNNSRARRSCQTALYYMLEALVRWLAPILSFTAEEIWQHMPGQHAEPSVFLSRFFNDFPPISEDQAYWRWIMAVRDEVNKRLEIRRAEGVIGSSLDAEIILYADETVYVQLARLGDELRFALITSAARVVPDGECTAANAEECAIPGVRIEIRIVEHAKCVRCWQRREDIGRVADHRTLCGRCVENVMGSGEERYFA